MASIINASTSGVGGVITTADNSGDLNIQSGGSTKIAVTSAGVAVTGLAKASLPAGSILQVISLSGAANTSTSSSTFVDTNLTLSITPTSATSKILCFYSATVDMTGSTIKDTQIQLVRGATSLISGYGYFNASGVTEAILTLSNNYLDSPATTSATTYKIQVKCANSSSALVYGSTYSSFTLMEIAA
jgi:hypothetical protein